MDREQLKVVLKSKENKLAGKMIDAINADAPVTELIKLMDAGASPVYYCRSTTRPRSAYEIHPVIQACFKTSFGILGKAVGEGFTTLSLGFSTSSKPAALETLIDHPAFAGALQEREYHKAVDSTFYSPDEGKRAIAKVILKSGVIDINVYAARSYSWSNTVEGYEFMLEQGMDPFAQDVLDYALSFIGCDPNGVPPEKGRPEVVRRMLELGVPAYKPLNNGCSWQGIRRIAVEYKLLDRLVELGVLTKEHPEGFERYLEGVRQEEARMAQAKADHEARKAQHASHT